MKRLIVSTSTSCLNYLDKPDNVKMLPMNVHIRNQDYLDGQDLTIEQLSTFILANPDVQPTTSAPSQQQLINFFENLVNEGVEEVLVICVSETLSLTAANIRQVRDMFIDRLSIHIFNSRSVSHGEAILVYKAAQMFKENALISEIVAHLNQIRDKTSMYITVDNLKAMVRTKRLSAPAGFLANLFNIKPIVVVDIKGQVSAHEKVRSFERSLVRLAELIDGHARNRKGQLYIMANTINPYLNELKQILERMGYHQVPIMPVASVSVANIGVYAIGVLFVEH
ncbi:DegV family protein [Moraxella sp. ZY210820]|uniref:DegV family protein n=1 Tax=unclassified Moraxella TaxID=2685852 RepID=UPI0027306A74|nr:DegV family protein [Moraxella sp. ZY210820]WLF84463.1 DegV family protein [Moraxella sp. ZY210820]